MQLKTISTLVLVALGGLTSHVWAADATSGASQKTDAVSRATQAVKHERTESVSTPQVRHTVAVTDMTPNAYSFVDAKASGIVYNGHEYHYDTLSGPTLIPSRKVVQVAPMSPEEKEAKMYWTAEPPLGLIEGEYYGLEFTFPHRDLEFGASADLVVSHGKIVHLEMDERLDPKYYDKYWAGSKKRRSGYTFFQQSKGRTDDTLVTWGNGITFLEYQVLKNQSLNFPLSTVYGSSNSARDAFIPAIEKLNKMVEKPSGQYYIGLTKPLENGVLARLQLVFEGKKIIKAQYDEIFPDTKAQILDANLKKYYRTSKYEGLQYQDDTKGAFRTFADSLSAAIVQANSVQVKLDNALPEMANFEALAKAIEPAIARYLKSGYKHEIGVINQPPKGFVVNPTLMSRKGDITMALVGQTYDAATHTFTVKVKAGNVSHAPYELKLGNFYLYALSPKNNYDTVGSQTKDVVTLKPGETVEVEVPIKPVYPDDKDLNLKYDGPNKIYFEMPIDHL